MAGIVRKLSLLPRAEGAQDGAMSSHRVVIVVRDGIQSLDATGPFEVFHASGQVNAAATYDIVLSAPELGTITTESGLRLGVDARLADIDRVDTLMVAGGRGMRDAIADGPFLAQVQRLAALAPRVTSVCTGAAVLAAAGLLDGKRATTHWAYAGWLARHWPAVEVDPDAIFVQDGSIWTSAGVTAGMDLALALVAADHGPEIAHTVATWLVMFIRRAGGQSQFSPQLRAAEPSHPSLQALLAQLPAELAGDLSVRRLAERCGMSERTFARAFRAQTGITPAAHVEELRVDAAQRLLETTDLGVAAIAQVVGLGSAETLHRSFRRRVGTTPASYRNHFARV
jgi:transcriptional regulator GlxA family with amidase domain